MADEILQHHAFCQELTVLKPAGFILVKPALNFTKTLTSSSASAIHL
jgi:hypothetical protein